MIHHFGTFDVSNYGDLLFPLVLEMRLKASETGRRASDAEERESLVPAQRFAHLSPVGGSPPLAGGVKSTASRPIDALAAARGERLEGVIVGGGHLIHASPSGVERYRSSPELALQAYPSLWLGAAYWALQQNVPLIWNAPGIPAALGPEASRLLCWATSFCDYLAVRDERSLRLLQLAGFEGDAAVAPDTAHEVARLFTEPEIDLAYRHAFEDRNQSPATQSISFHLNARYLGEEPGLLARRIDQICMQADSTPILIGLGACHGDDVLAREVGAALRSNALVVDSPRSLAEAAACIARSRAYLGSSLHGAITACAFGVPAMIVASEREDGGKFSEFLGDHDLGEWLRPNWDDAAARAAELLGADPAPWRAVRERVQPALDRHWQKVERALSEPPRHPDARRDAAGRFEALTRDVLARAGLYSALLPEQAALAVAQQDSIEGLREHARNLKASYRSANRELRLKIAALEPSEPDRSEN